LKFIDSNCMLGPWHFGKLCIESENELIMEMDRLGIEKALLLDSRSWFWDPTEGNKLLAQQLKNRDRLIPVMALTPLIDEEFGGEEKVREFICTHRVGAVKLFPNDHGFMLDHWNADVLFSMLNDMKMPAIIECSPLEGVIDTYLPGIYSLACAYPDTPIIMAAMRLQSLRLLYPLLKKCPNIFTDTAMLFAFRGIEDIVENFGAERIVMGTRMPFLNGGRTVGRVIYAGIRDSDREKIAYANLQQILENIKYRREGRRSI